MRDIDLMSPEKVASQYGGDKRKIAQAVQAGVLNPTVAVMAGMFIDRMRAAAAQEQRPETTVAQEVLARPRAGLMAAQTAPMERGLDALPVPEDAVPSYESGGIVAFQNTGFVDLQSIRMGKSKHPFEDTIIENARRRGEDPTRDLELLYRETGGIKDAERALSPKGARGIMQIMPATAMNPGFGVPSIFTLAKERGIAVPDMSAETADKLLQNPSLNAEFGSRYRSAMEKRFGGDPVLAAAAYNAGPGAVQQAGGVPNIPETRKYVAGISPERFEAASQKVRAARREQLGTGTLSPQGSVIPGPSVMEGTDKEPTDYAALLASRSLRPATQGLGSTFDPFLGTGVEERGLSAITPKGPTKEDVEERQRQFSEFLSGQRRITPASPEMAAKAEDERRAEEVKKKPTKVEKAAEKKDTYGDKLERLLTEREGRLAAQKEQDKNLAILAAGLGMMAGKSPYAAQNIGAGALKGIEQYAGARKLTRQEEEDILAGRLGQYRFGEESRIRGEDRRLNQGMTLASMEEKRIRDEFSKILGNVIDPRNAQLQELIKRDPDYVDRMAISGRNRILQAYGIDFGEQEPTGSIVARDYSKWGKLNVGK